jgi:polar amino acid transport system substrate-binding protein
MVLVFSLLGALLSSCGQTKPAQEPEVASGTEATSGLIDEVVKRGTLRVGCDFFTPWVFKDKSGELVGFEIDVARRLAEEMGVEVEFVPTQWSGIIPALLTGKFDVIIGGMGITTERALKVNFTIPYDYSGMSIAASRQIAPDRASLEDFNAPDVVIAVRLGATPVAAAQKHLPKAQLRQFEDEAQVIQEVLNGRADAFLSSAPKPEDMVLTYPDDLYLPLRGETFTKEPIGFALRKGDFDAVNFFNSWIQRVWDEGWLQERHYYWFVSGEWKSLVE